MQAHQWTANVGTASARAKRSRSLRAYAQEREPGKITAKGHGRTTTIASRSGCRASQSCALSRGQVRESRRSARRSDSGRHRRPAQGDRSLRSRARRRVHDLRDADDRRRDQALLPRQGLGGQGPAPPQELNLAVNRAIEKLNVKLGRSPTVAELAGHLGATEEDVLEAQELGQAYNLLSLDTELTATATRSRRRLPITSDRTTPGSSCSRTARTSSVPSRSSPGANA